MTLSESVADAVLDGVLWLIAAILVWRTTKGMSKIGKLEVKDEDKAATGLARPLNLQLESKQ